VKNCTVELVIRVGNSHLTEQFILKEVGGAFSQFQIKNRTRKTFEKLHKKQFLRCKNTA
jgi:hypothetical protein